MRIRAVCLMIIGCLFAAHAVEATPVVRTQAEVEKLIETDGATPPAWLETAKLNYPPTLQLHWERPKNKEPWTPNKYLSQYVWSVVNENPGRWREGLKLLYHVLDVNKDDPEKYKQTQKAIARNYQLLQQDPLRAAYWWKKSKIEKSGDPTDSVELADCYLKLGNKDFPRALLTKIGNDDSRHGETIKLWADMGEYQKALDVADIKADDDENPDIGFLMAGEIYRRMGKPNEAIEKFQKVLAMNDKSGGHDIKQSKSRARASLEATKLYDALDLAKVADGMYTSESAGYSGLVSVAVDVKANKIETVKVIKHTEKQYYGSLTDTPARIVLKQTVKGLDAYSGATITSEAIINATAKALAKGIK